MCSHHKTGVKCWRAEFIESFGAVVVGRVPTCQNVSGNKRPSSPQGKDTNKRPERLETQ